MEYFKLSSYGFIHFDTLEDKEEFYRETKDKKFRLKGSVVVHFLPLRRTHSEKHVICQLL